MLIERYGYLIQNTVNIIIAMILFDFKIGQTLLSTYTLLIFAQYFILHKNFCIIMNGEQKQLITQFWRQKDVIGDNGHIF